MIFYEEKQSHLEKKKGNAASIFEDYILFIDFF